MKPLRVEPALCVRDRSTRAACRRCADACPAAAIALAKGPEVSDACTGCGLCVPACPTGAFQLEQPSDPTVLGEAARIAGDPVIFTCGPEAMALREDGIRGRPGARGGQVRLADIQDRLITVPCTGFLSADLLAGVLATGHRRVFVLQTSACDTCVNQVGAQRAAEAVAAVQALLPGSAALVDLNGLQDGLQECPEVDRGPAPEGTGRAGRSRDARRAAHDRREFLNSAVNGAVVLVRQLFSPWASDAKTDPPAPRPPQQAAPSHRRKMCVQALAALQLPAGTQTGLCAPVAGPGCTLCGACSRLCPTGALLLTEEPGTRTLRWRADRCVSCNLCREICPATAMRVGDQVSVGQVSSAEPARLVAGPRTTCACGTPYWQVPGGPASCVRCRMRLPSG